MKKYLIIALFLLSPTLIYGTITYSRTPIGTEITSPVTVSVSVDDWIELFPYGNYDYICVYGENTGVYYHSNEAIASSSLSGVFTMDLAVGVSLNTIALFSDDTIEGCLSEFATESSNDLENGEPIFTIVDGGETATDTSATSTINQAQQNIFNGFLLFFIMMWFIVWSFRNRKI